MTDRRLYVAAALGLLVAGSVLAVVLGSAQATAMEEREPARERARSWNDDAQLAEVVGVEGRIRVAFQGFGGGYNWSGWGGGYGGYGSYGGSGGYGSDRSPRTQASPAAGGSGDAGDGSGSQDGWAGYWSRARADGSPGDGEAELWVYTFVARDEPDTAFEVAVDRNGTVLHAGEESREDGEEALGDWSVDSDEAAETALEENQGLREAREAPHHGFVYVLEGEEDHRNPVWTVAGGGGGDGDGAGGVVRVDAETGEVLVSHGGS